MKRATLAVLAIVLSGLCREATGQEKQSTPVVAVFNIENRGSPLSADQLITLTDYLSTRLGEQGRYRIIPGQEIRQRLTKQKKESYKACYDQSCQIEIGRDLTAEFTVSSSIGRIGGLCLISVAMYDLRKAATARTATAKAPCEVEQLVTAIEEVSERLQSTEVASRSQPFPPEPKKVEPLPPVVYAPRVEEPTLSGNFSEIHLTSSYFTIVGGSVVEPGLPLLGFAATLDFHLGDWFVLGPAIRLFLGTAEMYDLSIRAGALIHLSKTFLLHPYLVGGFTYATVEFEEFPGDGWDVIGFHARGGLGLKWMFNRGFGICADLVLGFASAIGAETEVEDLDGQFLETGVNLGVVVEW